MVFQNETSLWFERDDDVTVAFFLRLNTRNWMYTGNDSLSHISILAETMCSVTPKFMIYVRSSSNVHLNFIISSFLWLYIFSLIRPPPSFKFTPNWIWPIVALTGSTHSLSG